MARPVQFQIFSCSAAPIINVYDLQSAKSSVRMGGAQVGAGLARGCCLPHYSLAWRGHRTQGKIWGVAWLGQEIGGLAGCWSRNFGASKGGLL
ncbi:hypothetical protein EPI10_029127 [Gossypium australe]|uniref:Uncharacterized protein n=1 Tax=Gossypium australe TaxID=47621 RepID=A0A5B6V0T2_9ROSI|nr:hypothetical protein EPI10_029127 [Gossypium australe]